MGLLAFCSIAVLLGAAHSQPTPDVATTIFNILNTGHKSFVTPAEFIAYYSQFDKDGKGSISKQDFLKLYTDQAKAERQFTLYDVDKDGALTLNDVKLIVDKFDTDSDGKITLAEFKASYATLLVGYDNTPVGDGSITKQDYFKLVTDHSEAERQFKLYDVDHDGVLTLKDVKFIVNRFDTDSDGKITMAEFKANYATLIAGHDNHPVGK